MSVDCTFPTRVEAADAGAGARVRDGSACAWNTPPAPTLAESDTEDIYGHAACDSDGSACRSRSDARRGLTRRSRRPVHRGRGRRRRVRLLRRRSVHGHILSRIHPWAGLRLRRGALDSFTWPGLRVLVRLGFLRGASPHAQRPSTDTSGETPLHRLRQQHRRRRRTGAQARARGDAPAPRSSYAATSRARAADARSHPPPAAARPTAPRRC
mmetsp:Transcript_9083/g.27202  ORF Transcript_9083/g.27202 Transcript_9083/m.27202 type:complete len:212 (-) Transcript_9083:1500-2135(-)